MTFDELNKKLDSVPPEEIDKLHGNLRIIYFNFLQLHISAIGISYPRIRQSALLVSYEGMYYTLIQAAYLNMINLPEGFK